MLPETFILGFLSGIVVSLIYGGLWRLYLEEKKRRDAYKNPQIVVHTTSKTPERVSDESKEAIFRILLLRIVAIVLGWIILWFIAPTWAELIITVLVMLLGLVVDTVTSIF
ncbi:MAG: hypothetical protein R3E79_37610 [Caldilineaceae bacterium]